MMRLLAHRACEPTTRRRAQLIDDRPWYASRHFQEVRRPMRIDDALYSMHPIRGTSLLTALILNRPFGRRRPFESREARLLHLFHASTGWLFRSNAAASPVRTDVIPLSPRQRQTLRYLLTGESEKQIARALGRSKHTVHTYVKQIYRSFGACSRGELLSQFLKEPVNGN